MLTIFVHFYGEIRLILILLWHNLLKVQKLWKFCIQSDVAGHWQTKSIILAQISSQGEDVCEKLCEQGQNKCTSVLELRSTSIIFR